MIHSFIRVCSVAATLHINKTSFDTCTVITPPHENAASIAINVVHLRSFTRHVHTKQKTKISIIILKPSLPGVPTKFCCCA
ncbi:hypothetical protein PIB30_084921 [Stylosanthes scabra]|uniref:Secreted protein n=1 Tax=Stylosanthes scabra TaxID=79078 RepID=A0ABU6RTA2_9FABA|nr:hypothetical protein [Stylosanthes scabra]